MTQELVGTQTETPITIQLYYWIAEFKRKTVYIGPLHIIFQTIEI